MVSLEIAAGFRLPFYPMRPTHGRDLRTLASIKLLWQEIKDDGVWVAQPKLNGDRVCLAVHERRIYVQNRHGRCYRRKVANAAAYLRLPDGTCLDGEVFKQNFYPFELLALKGRSFLGTTTVERVVLAKQLSDFLKQPWLFPQLNPDWLARRSANLPHYEGVVLKKSSATYRLQGSPTQTSLDWFKRLW